jgi:hypothetical protein
MNLFYNVTKHLEKIRSVCGGHLISTNGTPLIYKVLNENLDGTLGGTQC